MQLASRRSRLEGRVLWPASPGLVGCKNAGTMTDSHQRDRPCGTGHFRLTNALTGCQGPRSEPPCTHVPRCLLPKGYAWLQGLCHFSPILLPDAHTHEASGASRTSSDLQRGPPWPLQNILGVGDSHFTGSDPRFATNVGLKQCPPMPSVPCPPGTLAGLLSSSPRKKEGKVPCSEVFPHKMEDARQI